MDATSNTNAIMLSRESPLKRPSSPSYHDPSRGRVYEICISKKHRVSCWGPENTRKQTVPHTNLREGAQVISTGNGHSVLYIAPPGVDS